MDGLFVKNADASVIKAIKAAYDSGVPLVAWTAHIRQGGINQKLTHREMIAMFENLPDWQRKTESSGHVTFQSYITGLTIGFSGHNRAATINMPAKKDYLRIIQIYLNILNDCLFYEKNWRWETSPDFFRAHQRYKNWINTGKPMQKIELSVEKTLNHVNCVPRNSSIMKMANNTI